MKTLKLFNAVLKYDSDESTYISRDGYVIEPGALWAKDQIVKYYRENKLDGYGLNKTFHKSWRKIFKSNREDLLMHQIRHYVSTYGSKHQADIYIPNELLQVPNAELKFRLVKAYTKQQLITKSLGLLQSGIALKEETINDILSVLTDQLSYTFTGEEGIKNKEAIVKIADLYGVLPSDTLEFFRYIIYRTTGDSLLIKSPEAIELIKASNYNPAVQFDRFGLVKLAEIFNRFKPLFLAYKSKCPKTINKISKLSKRYHKPLVTNPLNRATNLFLTENDRHWLDNATPFALFRALSACRTRMYGQHSFVYRIRNGKSFIRSKSYSGVVWQNYEFLLDHCRRVFDMKGKKFFMPKDVELALPTSEKMFVGNIPTGSRFYARSMAVGVYWENSWGARDLDLSGINIAGKIGWNSRYKQAGGNLMYSGDITDAPRGAAEYLYAKHGLKDPTLVKNNVYAGDSNCTYKIIIGKGDNIDYDYMINPNNLFLEVECQSVQKESILGLLMPEENKQCFVLLNFGAGSARVSGNSKLSNTANKALYEQWSYAMSLSEMLLALGAEQTLDKDQADYDFSLDHLQKDTIINVFTENRKSLKRRAS